jgi:RNA polymerase sigma factor (TIGR02999 family)
MSVSSDRDTVSRLLREIGSLEGADPAARNQLFAAVYEELHRLARGLMRAERRDHTLRPTALVHEAFLRLVERDGPAWESRAHFFGIAARAMRQVLVDHARARAAEKRGGGLTRITLGDDVSDGSTQAWEILHLHAALEKLALEDDRVARVAELRIFVGLTGREAAELLRVSTRTAEGDWKMARLWLLRELGPAPA